MTGRLIRLIPEVGQLTRLGNGQGVRWLLDFPKIEVWEGGETPKTGWRITPPYFVSENPFSVGRPANLHR